MAWTDDDRAAFAADVPVFVEAAEDGTWRVVSTGGGEVLSSEHATPKQALGAALELDSMKGFVKSANLRQDGEPDGQWRWLDATAVEDAPLGGVRIGEQAIWEMAAGLNARASAVPVNGGGAPEGMATSEPHGDAVKGGDHPANGFAHVGVPVAKQSRLHLYLYSELLPEVATEVDRGRLAYGSVYFAFDAADADDNGAAKGATLISHALTNNPAVTTLSAGSERARVGDAHHARRAMRSAWRHTMTEDQIRALIETARSAETSAERMGAARELLLAARGPIGDAFAQVAAALGVSDAERMENPWALEDAIWQFQMGAKAEQRLEALAPPTPPAETEPGSVAASASMRAVEGLEPDAVDAFAQGVVDKLRVVFGKPDAMPEDLMAELDARAEELAAALMESEEDPGEESEMSAEEQAQDSSGEVAASASTRGARDPNAAPSKSAREVELESKVATFEERDWLDAECAKRGIKISGAKRDKYVAMSLRAGREVVEEILEAANRPPSSNPMDTEAAPMGSRSDSNPTTQTAAFDACEAEAARICEEEEARLAKKQRREPREVASHVIRSRAQKLAREHFPQLFEVAAPPAAR